MTVYGLVNFCLVAISTMGFCFSYCRRRRSPNDDHEPLLPQAAINGDIPPPQSYLDKAADVFAALRVGKLPSQDQINAALRKVLHSQVLSVEDNKSARVQGRRQQYGPLSERGKIMLNDIRELVEAIMQFGMEKNGLSLSRLDLLAAHLWGKTMIAYKI